MGSRGFLHQIRLDGNLKHNTALPGTGVFDVLSRESWGDEQSIGRESK
jgi:hypothetical protein